MSLNTIGAKVDGMKTTTSKFATVRGLSHNLATNDIQGAVPKLHGSRAVSSTKEQFNLMNHDIERSAPRQLHIGLNKQENAMRTDDILFAKP